MKKYAGMTWWKNNYGSILQAYALSKVINEFDGIEYEVIQQFSINPININNLFESICERGVINTIKYVCIKFGMHRIRQRNINCENFVRENIKISDQRYSNDTLDKLNELYDGFLCGSDQIWNPSITVLGGKYWLNFARNEKIAYAPSLGVTELKEDEKSRLFNALSDFKAVSCREKRGTELINNIMGEEICHTVLDPTLLLSKADWDIKASQRLIEKEYIFAYILRGDDSQKRLAREFAKRNNLLLVTIPFLEADYFSVSDFWFGDKKIVNASPADFISLIKYSSYVFTDSFHCMIFSSIYHKHFFMLKKYGRNQMLRINDFLEWMGLGNRVVESMEDIEKLLDENDELLLWGQYEKRLSAECKKSKEYLMESLNVER